LNVRKVQDYLRDVVINAMPASVHERRAQRFVRWLASHVPAGASVLDIGSGPGFLYRPLKAQASCDVTMVDVRSYDRARNPAVAGVEPILYDGRTLPFPDESFDVSLLVTVLHHCPDVEQVVREAVRVTRLKVLILEDVYETSWQRFTTVAKDWLSNMEFFGHPVSVNSVSGWTQYLEGLGLTVARAETEMHRKLGFKFLNGLYVISCDA